MAHALIFDSGVGGLSVSREIRDLLPALRQSYVADDIFRPYGEKTPAQLQARLPELLATLELMLSPDVIVIACNTASTTALDAIRAAVRAPVIGVVPAIKPAAQMTRTGTIAVLGTPGTVKRRYVDGLIRDHASDCHVILQGSVNLVDIAEAKLAGGAVDLARIKAELAPLFSGKHGADIDAVVLACTHFPLLKDELKASLTQSVRWIDSGAAIARRVKSVLDDKAVDIAKGFNSADNAFLIGPDTGAARAATFQDFGFARVIGLLS
ncbi:glutamate racemase [Fretibacter rubidus]|uniref:glutamate racemase n=1 Tax=Fretibacter rubidus TaxID=570162 RepID=UPI003529EBCB